MRISDYDYELPFEKIAAEPANPRDSSRLLVCDTKMGTISLDTFANVVKYLPAKSLLVLNNTKVVPARLELEKKSGGAVRILFLVNEWEGGEIIKGLPDRRVNVGDALSLNGRPLVEAVSQHNEEFAFRLLASREEFERIVHEVGKTPLPPYIKSGMTEQERRTTYQTVFAEKPASVAAPTASLHFTDRVFAALKEKDIGTAYVTLHVGRGTFSPVTDETVSEGKLHPEPIMMGAESAVQIHRAKEEGRMVIAAGTTAARVLESVAPAIRVNSAFSGETRLMIAPPYDFKVVDALITNFHLPKTSLIMLIDAFLEYKKCPISWRDLYERAKKENFRFYSFGDAMLLI